MARINWSMAISAPPTLGRKVSVTWRMRMGRGFTCGGSCGQSGFELVGSREVDDNQCWSVHEPEGSLSSSVKHLAALAWRASFVVHDAISGAEHAPAEGVCRDAQRAV